jgi:hypothetical protein
MAARQHRRDDRVQSVPLAQQILLEQEQPGEGSTDVPKADQGQADIANRPPGPFYACLTW